ncbi:hypothetical protein Tco_0444222, partial [Tanacetum coccineum]
MGITGGGICAVLPWKFVCSLSFVSSVSRSTTFLGEGLVGIEGPS